MKRVATLGALASTLMLAGCSGAEKQFDDFEDRWRDDNPTPVCAPTECDAGQTADLYGEHLFMAVLMLGNQPVPVIFDGAVQVNPTTEELIFTDMLPLSPLDPGAGPVAPGSQAWSATFPLNQGRVDAELPEIVIPAAALPIPGVTEDIILNLSICGRLCARATDQNPDPPQCGQVGGTVDVRPLVEVGMQSAGYMIRELGDASPSCIPGFVMPTESP